MVLNLVIEHLKVALGSNCAFMCVWVWVGTCALHLIPSNPPLFLPTLSLSSSSLSPVIFSILLLCCEFTRLGQRAGGLRSCGSICIDYFYCTINFSETWLAGLVFGTTGAGVQSLHWVEVYRAACTRSPLAECTFWLRPPASSCLMVHLSQRCFLEDA